MTPQQLGELAAVGTAVFWTLSAMAWTSAGKYVGAVSVSFVRLLIACVFLMIYGQCTRGMALPTDATASQWLYLGISGFLGFFVSDLCLFNAFLMIGPRRSLLVQSLTPPLAAIISWIFLSETFALRHWAAMGVTLAGIVWVVLEQPDIPHAPDQKKQQRLGLLLAVAAAVAQAFSFTLAKKGIDNYDPVATTFVRILGALAAYLALLTVLGHWRSILNTVRHRRAMTILSLGALVGPFIGVILSMVAIQHCQVGIVSTILATMPVLILPPTVLVYHEKVSLRAVAGAILSVIGVALLVL
jgi:drug/metabolite transporter (DMT)-like permease